jgi:hypothetical protein
MAGPDRPAPLAGDPAGQHPDHHRRDLVAAVAIVIGNLLADLPPLHRPAHELP